MQSVVGPTLVATATTFGKARKSSRLPACLYYMLSFLLYTALLCCCLSVKIKFCEKEGREIDPNGKF